MLKALELSGFKSFADRTRFDFPPGITVIVGPNGSGKSNVVDAIKWVLGEQSAKSLRGKDMSDVIFKGSGDGRRMLNTAEATIIFDNSGGQLPFDAPEVHITRRVYRSGEGEYLINRQPCRLKDIKELIRGTGAGADAYSLIEQGKVDRLLQASPKDRRAIFEEAAGISRFKAKKIEAQRRLERVDQNLVRLSDIVEEVDSRLRSVRSQAAKARRYREYSQRLQELRTQVGLSDWRRLSQQLAQSETATRQLSDQSRELAASIEAAEARVLELDVEAEEAAEAIRDCEHRVAHNHEQIALRDSADAQARARLHDLEQDLTRHRAQLAALTGRRGDLQQQLERVGQQVAEASSTDDALRTRLARDEQALAEHAELLAEARRQQAGLQTQRSQAAQQTSDMGGRIGNRQSHLETQQVIEQRCTRQLAELDAAAAEIGSEVEAHESKQKQLADQVDAARQALAEARSELAELERNRGEAQDETARHRQQFSAVTERAAVLEELESSLEGLADGVRDVLELARESESGPFADVQGLVADLLEADVDVAPIIDVVLGDRAQHVVLSSDRLLEEIQAQRFGPAGRVGFVRLEAPSSSDVGQPNLDGLPGVVSRLDRLVRCPPALAPAVRRLLGRTWLVETLAVALALRKTNAENRFVTWDGDLVEPDGTVAVGPRLSAAGLISRRSQLHALQIEAETLRETLTELQCRTGELDERFRVRRDDVERLAEEFKRSGDELAEQRVRTRAVQERRDHVLRQREGIVGELAAAQRERETAARELAEITAERARLQQVLDESESQLVEMDDRIRELDRQREHHALQATAAKVELSKSHEQLEILRARLDQLQEDRRERDRVMSDSRQQLVESNRRRLETERELLRSTSDRAAMYLEKEILAAQHRRLCTARDQFADERGKRNGEVQSLRRKTHKLEEEQHRHELAANEIRHDLKTLADRLREDYGIEISEVESAETAEQEQAREKVEEEIADLRRKVNNIGAVNLDALDELDELETRFGSLSSQYQDLTQAKAALERIIVRINADSRRLFQETLDAIRVNFQALYRKSFGGGKADIVLEEGVDPLEAGVEIIATPPGKPSFNNSLLSGGEKALTAVALLLGIFQYRPSPFCVLDEVDAPFDEANIGRFIDVLKDFLGWTKFIVVTHSKKTMTAATTLYGVTMQESGVSKQVSVRFEDVSDDGEISLEAIERSDSGDDDDERGAA